MMRTGIQLFHRKILHLLLMTLVTANFTTGFMLSKSASASASLGTTTNSLRVMHSNNLQITPEFNIGMHLSNEIASSEILSLGGDSIDIDAAMTLQQLSVPLIILAAAILGISSQSLINSMLKGDQGLSAFLSDGKGYNNSKFQERRRNDKGKDGAPLGNGDSSSDPLPWLKLPRLSFVDVAGQEKLPESEEIVAQNLQTLAMRGKQELDAGEKEKAAKTMEELNALMEDYGFEYTKNE